eukprot:TRINITY_DN18519_c0_g1_i1.p1 TRINITY_DN18519_c0_g1~~TRINITY_DN18519_c0_g1_i1.p1  ORF type:complete len:374 (+),score=108.69 TRINITY_DN18519_c0_g1_i1:140-1123(+)
MAGSRDLFQQNVLSTQSHDVDMGGKSAVASIPKLCDACKTVAARLQLALEDPSLVFKLKTILESSICKRLPEDKKDDCVERVEAAVPEVIALLQTRLTEQSLCISTKICPEPDLLPSSLSDAVPRTSSEVAEGPKDEETEEVAGLQILPTCALCEQIAMQAVVMLRDGVTQEEIKKRLNHECLELPLLSRKCQAILELYFPQMLSLLNHLSPSEVCSSMHLCTPTTLHLSKQQQQPQQETAIASSDRIFCQYIVDEIKSKLSDPDNQMKVLTFLMNECKKTRNHASVKKCQEGVTLYLPLALVALNEPLLCHSYAPKEGHQLEVASG